MFIKKNQSFFEIKVILRQNSLLRVVWGQSKKATPESGRLKNTYGKSTWKAAVSCPRITDPRALFSGFRAKVLFWAFTSWCVLGKKRKAYIVNIVSFVRKYTVWQKKN